ncbi:MAG: dihydrodipicolinate synthase family protein [Pirellulales bacterium]|nr:dihydrodipicolinate synthase family protein [Pirellulales bacterium]
MELAGVLSVIQTPWNDDWSIDRVALRREIDWNLAGGVDGIVIAMVSEVLRLTDDERAVLVAEVVGAVAGRHARDDGRSRFLVGSFRSRKQSEEAAPSAALRMAV